MRHKTTSYKYPIEGAAHTQMDMLTPNHNFYAERNFVLVDKRTPRHHWDYTWPHQLNKNKFQQTL